MSRSRCGNQSQPSAFNSGLKALHAHQYRWTWWHGGMAGICHRVGRVGGGLYRRGAVGQSRPGLAD